MRPEGVALRAETARYILGMPHLCPNGLSENWLWKELGHRHWNLIARGIGRAAAGFGRGSGQPTYAAFRRIALRGGDLGAVGENDMLDVHSTLTHLSGTRVESRHVVACSDKLMADVDMTSVFVQRQSSGVNRSIVRVRIETPHRTLSSSSGKSAAWLSPTKGSPALEAGNDEREIGAVVIEPCPQLDFNGAGLLYFSSFIAAVERAEWSLLGKGKRLSTTIERRAMFHSNIEVGDDLVVRILAAQGMAGLQHRSIISAVSDGRMLAEVVTHRGE